MKKLLLLLLLLSCLTYVKAGSIRTITGTVYDVKDHQPIAGVAVRIEGTPGGTSTDKTGQYKIIIPGNQITLIFTFIGYETKKVKLHGSTLDLSMQPSNSMLTEVVITGYPSQKRTSMTGSVASVNNAPIGLMDQALSSRVSGIVIRGRTKDKKSRFYTPQIIAGEESYKGITENSFQNPKESPLSTFSIDVDAASYSNVRRFINNGQLPPKDAVRIEEMINYFTYNFPSPSGNEPVAIHTEMSAAPWNTQHRLLRIGLKAKTVQTEKLPASNLVFLVDVSGSMNEINKLPLVQSSLKMLTNQLRAKDKVAIVVYAGSAGLVLPPTPGDQKITIKDAIDRLSAGGSTAGGQGIKLAYKVASENLSALHKQLQHRWQQWLIPQDKQRLWPHITIQNKVSLEESKALATTLSETFEPFEIYGTGLALWEYQGGPWRFIKNFPFAK
ncbi:MAG: VWA domain-containing protein [Sphingobacteriaceae bacterium]|nr:MAG: VWA domain-containing protein [Sphingobacteriaceae bacterium]